MLSSEEVTHDVRCDLRAYLQPAFVICVVVLAFSGVVMSRFEIEQEPWPLKQHLELLDNFDLEPYRVVSRHKIDNKDILRELGTDDYIQWVLEDMEAAQDSPVRKLVLFVTYYPLADRVPHVPEQCYTGVGHQLLDSDDMKYRVMTSDGPQNIPGTHLIFEIADADNWGVREKFSAFYLISVNGSYAGNRESARRALNRNMFKDHSYFSKVEWSFFTGPGARSDLSNAEATKATSAGEKLLSVILPILEREFWPQEKVENGHE